ncbi:NUDIX hydrolase [Paenibacillus sp. TRM 82003]|uniref:NUDIX domain-containing protein n=1 Tax=Kineococcus sp. TRM81007 TaxID=2925831 RepID=UPI001F592126|nr:NUDIX hydrolase [Kineococcus sp. TRM81007]MCI2240729.1 NUDIX hydrolase [Kineococcus sp. TRM81007]MCI3925347.1 NUDIX hydrolase [Paenibacillus sp. TRM 82003]
MSAFPEELGVPLVAAAEVADAPVQRPLRSSEVVFTGHVWDVVREVVELPGDDGAGSTVTRDVQRHPGAVTVLALDGDDNVLLIKQYRHPVRRELWELPAGLLDVAGEPPLRAAQRELAEEADLVAADWAVVVDWFNSPGGSSEANRIYLARGLSAVPLEQRHTREDEERDLVPVRVPLAEAVRAVLEGRLRNPGTVIGVLAVHAAQAAGFATLHPADEPWPEGLLRR